MSKKNPIPTKPCIPPLAVDPPRSASPAPAVFGSDAAPVVYFDGVVAFGVRDGIIQLELAVNELVPLSLEGTKIKAKVVVIAHLRCTASTALNLAEVIEQITTSPPPLQTKQ